MMQPDNFLTPTQAAELIGKNRTTVLRWCQRGKIKAQKIGNQWVIEWESLKQYVAKRTEHAKGE